METLKKLKSLYNDGVLILNKVMLEKIQLYLKEEKILDAAGVTKITEKKMKVTKDK